MKNYCVTMSRTHSMINGPMLREYYDVVEVRHGGVLYCYNVGSPPGGGLESETWYPPSAWHRVTYRKQTQEEA